MMDPTELTMIVRENGEMKYRSDPMLLDPCFVTMDSFVRAILVSIKGTIYNPNKYNFDRSKHMIENVYELNSMLYELLTSMKNKNDNNELYKFQITFDVIPSNMIMTIDIKANCSNDKHSMFYLKKY